MRCVKLQLGSLWITPARAGKTHVKAPFIQKIWDHPRSCGKDFFTTVSIASVMGSPPLVRERLKDLVHVGSFYRITPARAGKTDYMSYTKDKD